MPSLPWSYWAPRSLQTAPRISRGARSLGRGTEMSGEILMTSLFSLTNLTRMVVNERNDPLVGASIQVGEVV